MMTPHGGGRNILGNVDPHQEWGVNILGIKGEEISQAKLTPRGGGNILGNDDPLVGGKIS